MMPYLEGETLEARLRASRLPLDLTVAYGTRSALRSIGRTAPGKPMWGLLGLNTEDINRTNFGRPTDPVNHGMPRNIYSRVTATF